MEIGAKIRNAREDLELSQDEVARRIPMNQSSYSKIERDIQEPSMEQLKRICEILHLRPDYLLSLDSFSDSTANDLAFAKQIKELYQKYYK